MQTLDEIRELIEVYRVKKTKTRINWMIDREVKGIANLDELQELNQLASLILNQISEVIERAPCARSKEASK